MKTYNCFLLAIIAVASLTSCNDDESTQSNDSLSVTSYSVKYDDEIAFEGKKNLEIENSFIASYKDGVISGNHIGSTTGIYNGTQNIEITVTPKYSYVSYPCTNWNCSLSAVQKQQTGWTALSSSSETGLAYVKYSGTSVKYIEMYMFENGKLTSSTLLSPASEVSTYIDWLAQKYFLVPASNSEIASIGYDAYDASEATTGVAISAKTMSSSQYTLYSKYMYMTVLFPYTYSSTKAVHEVESNLDNSKIFEALNTLGFVCE